MKELKTKREAKEPIDDNTKFFTQCKDIVKDETGYRFEKSAWIDNGYLCSYHSIDELWNPEKYYRSCFCCSHARWEGEDYTCDIASDINRNDPNTIEAYKNSDVSLEHIWIPCRCIVKCQAFDEIKELNIIRNMKEMIDFMYKTFNMLDDWDGVCGYYGFEIPYDWDNNKAKCTIYEYYQNGGTFDKVPKEDEFPVVIYFDYNCEKSDELKWISLKGKEL